MAAGQDESTRLITQEMQKNRGRIYALLPQMRLYHRLLRSQVWLPFVMRGCLPHINREELHTDQWGLRRTIGRDGRILTVESVSREEPVDIVTGSSFAFGVGASSDATTLSSRIAQETGRATVLLSGHQYGLAQSFVQFMFFSGRYRNIRNIVIAGFGEIFYFHTCASLFRQFGTFPNNEQFLSGLNGELTGKLGNALYGAENRAFVPLTHKPERFEAERELLRETIRDVLTSWTRFAATLGARLTVVMQPSPELQPRRWSPEETELLQNYDSVSGLRETFDRCKRDYLEWHGADMQALADELGFVWIDINAKLDARRDGEWLHIDHIHMTDQGNQRAAEEIVPALA